MRTMTILRGLVSGLIAGAAFALLGASGGASGSPGPQATATDQHPSALFIEYCAKCHGQDGTGNTPKGKQLMARDFTDAEWQSSKNDAQLIKQVTDGGEDMPPFGKKLTKDQIEGLVKNDVRGFGKKK